MESELQKWATKASTFGNTSSTCVLNWPGGVYLAHTVTWTVSNAKPLACGPSIEGSLSLLSPLLLISTRVHARPGEVSLFVSPSASADNTRGRPPCCRAWSWRSCRCRCWWRSSPRPSSWGSRRGWRDNCSRGWNTEEAHLLPLQGVREGSTHNLFALHSTYPAGSCSGLCTLWSHSQRESLF